MCRGATIDLGPSPRYPDGILGFHGGRVIIFSTLLFASTGAGDTATGASEAELELLYAYRQVRAAGVVVEAEESGSLTVTLADGSEHELSLDDLEDPDGNRYLAVGDVYQEDEEGDAVTELRLYRYEPERLTDDELVSVWTEHNADADTGDVSDFRNRRSATYAAPEGVEMDEQLTDWLAAAGRGETVEVRVVMAETLELDLPASARHLAEVDPIYSLDRSEERLLAIEDQRTAVEASQRELRAELSSAAFSPETAYWLVNAFDVQLDSEAIEMLATDTRVARLELVSEVDALANDGTAIREAAQVQQFLDEGDDGSLGSGRNAYSRMLVVVWDHVVDIDHPAWGDGGVAGSRLVGAQKWDGTLGAWVPDANGKTQWDSGLDYTGNHHGTAVTAQVLADLTEGQDSSVSNFPGGGWAARTGMSTESYVVTLASAGNGPIRGIEQAMYLEADILNMSVGIGKGDSAMHCNAAHSLNQAVWAGFHDGVLIVAGAGNEGHAAANECTVLLPAYASGSVAVGGLKVPGEDLRSGAIYNPSSRGGDGWGRSVIDVVAPAGRSGDKLAIWDDSYGMAANGTSCNGGGCQGTSYATPVVSGAMANLKHHLMNMLGASWANDPGTLIASLLVMADREREADTGYNPITMEHDDLWGAGRLRARRFDAAGMDAPRRARWFTWTMADGDSTTWLTHPDTSGNNQALPSDVEWLNVALWWHEPNYGIYPGPADVSLKLKRVMPPWSYAHENTEPQKQRLLMSGTVGLGGYEWEVQVTGVNVPTSVDPDYFYGQQKRQMHMVVFWEDRDRDDADGPDSTIR